MKWILFYAAIEFSYFLSGGLALSGEDEIAPETYQVGLEGEVRLLNWRESYLYIGGTIEVPVQPQEWNAWTPLYLDSVTRIGVRAGQVVFGFEHRCAHPVVVWSEAPASKWELWSERVFVRVETGR